VDLLVYVLIVSEREHPCSRQARPSFTRGLTSLLSGPWQGCHLFRQITYVPAIPQVSFCTPSKPGLTKLRTSLTPPFPEHLFGNLI
jgi:hypothetical protein